MIHPGAVIADTNPHAMSNRGMTTNLLDQSEFSKPAESHKNYLGILWTIRPMRQLARMCEFTRRDWLWLNSQRPFLVRFAQPATRRVRFALPRLAVFFHLLRASAPSWRFFPSH